MTDTESPKRDLKFYLDEFKSEECFCGKTKKARFSFCYGCYMSLPNEMQRALWRPFGRGYEEAYEEAVQWLT